jgi:hypothetical protein
MNEGNAPLNEGNAPHENSGWTIDQKFLTGWSMYQNVSQELIAVTADKVRLCLRDYKDSLKARDKWIAPAGILATLLTTLATTEFKAFFGLEAAGVKALYVLTAILCAIWLCVSLVRLLQASRSDDVESIVLELKEGSRRSRPNRKTPSRPL